jgi:hypothetical protein
MLDTGNCYWTCLDLFKDCDCDDCFVACFWYGPCQGLMAVAAVDLFVINFADMFVHPSVRAWIPVADGSQAF